MEERSITIDERREAFQRNRIWGVSFEDISHAVDGGIYGELVQNRSFEFDAQDHEGYHSLTGWSLIQRDYSVARLHVEQLDFRNRCNPHYAVLEVTSSGTGGGLSNCGYEQGIHLEAGKSYLFSCFYRRRGNAVPVWVRLEHADGSKVYAEKTFSPASGDWDFIELHLTSSGTDEEARLVVLLKEPSIIEFDVISLFSEDTFRGQKNGLRRDIAEKIEALHPAFFKFPGGNLINIGSLNQKDRCCIYRWKNTVLPVWERPVKRNPYGYSQSLGVGFYEYFLFCEEIGTEPIPVLSVGVDFGAFRLTPLSEMAEWIDDALDLIEFANGSVDTKWGKIRAQLGHPESFHMHYLELGSDADQIGYLERYEIICRAVKKKYPEMIMIMSCGDVGKQDNYSCKRKVARSVGTELLDRRLYVTQEWILSASNLFGGDQEWIVGGFDAGRFINQDNFLPILLGEAILMIKLEKEENVRMASFAPLLKSAAYSNWLRAFLNFDHKHVWESGIYQISRLFARAGSGAMLLTENDFPPPAITPFTLGGFIAMRTEYANVEIRNFCIHDEETERDILFGDFELSEKNKFVTCSKIGSSDYSISFEYCKKEVSHAKNVSGGLEFNLEFAMDNQGKKCVWRIDAWGGVTRVDQTWSRGAGNILDAVIFESEADRVYDAKLCVKGRKITTYLDGRQISEVVCEDKREQALYYNVMKKPDGRLAIKAVNLEGEKKLVIRLPEWSGGTAAVTTLCKEYLQDSEFSGCSLDLPDDEQVYFEGDRVSVFLPGGSVSLILLTQEVT